MSGTPPDRRAGDFATPPPEQRIIPRPEPGALDPQSIVDAFAVRMMYTLARDGYNATEADAYQALAYAVRDRLMERWFATQDDYYKRDVKRVYYLSLEFLLGRLLVSSITSLGATGEYEAAMKQLGFDLEDLAGCESDAGLGNGGLGRLAACFIDSAATLSIPFYGYGIRYEFGIFRQNISPDGRQVEAPDPWLRYGNPWEVPRSDVLMPVRFHGRSEGFVDQDGVTRRRWVETADVYAMAYDLAMPGYRNDTVNTLRLWGAKSSREFDLEKFNTGNYAAAVADKTDSENISKVLYPPDDQYIGRELRLRQQYFFVSATIQDIIRRFRKYPKRGWHELPDEVAIQLNDTHPSIAIPELMRVLVDESHLEWDDAWRISERVFGYTNHTVLAEALETWPVDMMRNLLPRHMEIIEEIDRRLHLIVLEVFPGDEARAKRMAIIDADSKRVRMAHLAFAGSHSVNGVARLHTDILRQRLFADFHQLYPQRLNNKTNGITPRRWLLQANPELAALINESVGDTWPHDMDRLLELESFSNDTAFLERWRAVKHTRKEILAKWLRRTHGIDVDPRSLFDVQIKRIHEYKRQLLNVLHVLALYDRISDGDTSVVPRTVMFGGKAAPGYVLAKLVIRLIHEVSRLVRRNPRVSSVLNVVFVPNYGVTSAEVLFPATELSEQISTAGTEASGTGCMKAVMNGGVIIGTHDGANIEIGEAVGAENILMFGAKTNEIEALQSGGYDARRLVIASPALTRVVERLESWKDFAPIIEAIVTNDRYFHCLDFESYVSVQQQAERLWLDNETWTRMSLRNTARSGRFSADRTVAEYAREIWNVDEPAAPDKGPQS
jgi:starch phosphorylase